MGREGRCTGTRAHRCAHSRHRAHEGARPRVNVQEREKADEPRRGLCAPETVAGEGGASSKKPQISIYADLQEILSVFYTKEALSSFPQKF